MKQILEFGGWLGLGLFFSCGSPAGATDYFITIGGGYSPQANQASLEANVLFFQRVLLEKHQGPRTQAVFFADGIHSEPDLQVLRPRAPLTAAANSRTPATDLLTNLYSFRGAQAVEYRNHQVPDVAGPNEPARIRSSLKSMCGSMLSGDRLIVYVTAHGGAAKGRNKQNTTISCWSDQSISAREFENWLDDVPPEVPVVMIMAQCYCGGFAHTIFENANHESGFSDRLRVGFFAQQHDLAAAGCRPDIDNDEEYSSFFWGAFVGRSRTGRAMESADFDGNGLVSFAEAHAHALLASETIDIPLRTSEALLRVFSRIGGYDHRRGVTSDGDDSADPAINDLAAMVGTLREICSTASPELARTVVGLAGQLGMEFDDDVALLLEKFEEERSRNRQLRRDSFRGRRARGSGRRELRDEISDRWPELADQGSWHKATVLSEDNQHQLLKDIEQLPSYGRFVEYQEKREANAAVMEQGELREVKYQRLINALEAILLAENLPKIASDEVVDRYRKIVAVEQANLRPR